LAKARRAKKWLFWDATRAFIIGKADFSVAARGARVVIEQSMYFALGFLVAGLFTLMFLPAFWRRAMRLSMRRLRMTAPMSMEQVVAERDLLRAEASANYRRLEQGMEAVKASKAQDMLTIGRHAAHIADLDKELKEQRAATFDAEERLRHTEKIVQERTDLLSSTEAALLEMTERAERGVERLRNLRSDHEELGRQSEMHLTRVAAHETKIAKMHARNTDLQRELEELREKHALVSAEAERLAATDARLAETTSTLKATQEEKSALQKELQATQSQLQALENRRLDEVERLEATLRSARQEEKNQADRLEIARSDNAMLQGTIEALRRDHVTLRQNNNASGARSHDSGGDGLIERDITVLRHAIDDIGARMADIAAAHEQEPPQSKIA
jgi:chromosome segregation ATPase